MFKIAVYSNADLQLDVKGCQDVYASFDKYVEVERLEGDNKYHADKHGLQVSIMDPVNPLSLRQHDRIITGPCKNIKLNLTKLAFVLTVIT